MASSGYASNASSWCAKCQCKRGILLEARQFIARARTYADFAINQKGGGDSVNGVLVLTMTLGKDCATPQ